jgi:hypothetical protein
MSPHAKYPTNRAIFITCSRVSLQISKQELVSTPKIRMNEMKQPILENGGLCFLYSGDAVSRKHNQRDTRYKMLLSAIYRMPLFNSCTH